MIYKVTFYDWMRTQKTAYCFGTLAQVQKFVDDLPDINDVLIVKCESMTLIKPNGFITLVDCTVN